MKLGTQTGSLTNHVLSRMVVGQPTPKQGMGATILCWTDRHAATIVNVWKLGTTTFLTVQEDTATRTDKNGLSESQTYEYRPNSNGAFTDFRQAKNGAWEQVTLNPKTKRWNKVEGSGLRIGERQEYRDPSF